ncbi:MAG: glutamate--tRNA ligase [Acetobacteraceae bacterium]|nr:glutamate--tRNA ligase [Acetobacteraceae bacterium]
MRFLSRFAVPPVGFLTVAQARLALANRDLARQAGGTYAVRFDDIDHDDAGSAERIRQHLRWLGIDWDAEFHQSERAALYAHAIGKLKEARRLYPCFENEDELRTKRERRVRVGKSPIYDRAMLKLTPAQRAAAEGNGKLPYWRFLLSGGEVSWKEASGERQQLKLSTLSDPVLLWADGGVHPTLASAIDDIELGISLLARGADEVANSAIQYDIRAALGANPGAIALSHLPALVDATRGKRARTLEKLTIRQLRHDGIEAEALAAYLRGLGADPRFDSAVLLERNRKILADCPFDDVKDRLPEGADAAFWQAVRGHIDLLPEAWQWWAIARGEIVPPILDGAAIILSTSYATMPEEPWHDGTWSVWLAVLGTQTDQPDAILLRLALTGEEAGPPMDQILPLIGRARVERRLRGVMRVG